MEVVAVKSLPSFELDLTYDDGTHRRFDMNPLLSAKPWNKVSTLPLFMQAKVAYGTAHLVGHVSSTPPCLLSSRGDN